MMVVICNCVWNLSWVSDPYCQDPGTDRGPREHSRDYNQGFSYKMAQRPMTISLQELSQVQSERWDGSTCFVVTDYKKSILFRHWFSIGGFERTVCFSCVKRWLHHTLSLVICHFLDNVNFTLADLLCDIIGGVFSLRNQEDIY